MTKNMSEDPEERAEPTPTGERRVPRVERLSDSLQGVREERFLKQVRGTTCYGTLRKVINVSSNIVIVASALALLRLLFEASSDRSSNPFGIAVGLVLLGALLFVLIKAAREASILLVDIADILIWHGSRSPRERD